VSTDNYYFKNKTHFIYISNEALSLGIEGANFKKYESLLGIMLTKVVYSFNRV